MLTLTQDWNHVPAGTVLEVLDPAEPDAPGRIDARRAAALLEQGLAVEGEIAPRPKKGRVSHG